MQLMTWTLARLGSRFSLLFEPQHRRVRHSALGRFLDRPMDLMVGLVDPGGSQRVLPFTTHGESLDHLEQFERLNSITFRGFCPQYRLRFELNVHSVFYPQDIPLCTMPAYYLEMRVSPTDSIRGVVPSGPTPDKVRLFIRINRPDTQISASTPGDPAQPYGGQIDLAYRNPLTTVEADDPAAPIAPNAPTVEIRERIVSLNPNCITDPDGKGLSIELPVTGIGSGIKWRLVWGAHCGEPVFRVGPGHNAPAEPLRYLRQWPDLDAVMDDAVAHRDDRLAHSRRLERLIDQAPLGMAQRHLLNQGFQAFLSNTAWCSRDDQADWLAIWDRRPGQPSSITTGCHSAMVFLALWPDLLAKLLKQWATRESPHEPSGGACLRHDAPPGIDTPGQPSPGTTPIEESGYFLLLLMAYTRWSGDPAPARDLAPLVDRLAKYLLWTDRDNSGFPHPSASAPPTDTLFATSDPRKQTHLAVTRLAAIQAAADLLPHADRHEQAQLCQQVVEADTDKIEARAWLGDHYALCLDDAPPANPLDPWALDTSAHTVLLPADTFAMFTANSLLLGMMTARPLPLDPDKLATDLTHTTRETLAAYGCGLTSSKIEDIWISHNLWRDQLALYLDRKLPAMAQRYWDMQVACNTHQQSLGYSDTYVGHDTSFCARGAAAFGVLLARPRLVIDRLAPGGTRISVEPNRAFPQRWPLLPLANWKAGKIPVCVVDTEGRVTIEGETDPVIIHGEQAAATKVIG